MQVHDYEAASTNIHNISKGSKTEILYRVWREQEEWKAAQVRNIV